MNILTGYKTYIIATVALITIGANLLGFVDSNTANTILSIFGFGGMITLRSAIANS